MLSFSLQTHVRMEVLALMVLEIMTACVWQDLEVAIAKMTLMSAHLILAKIMQSAMIMSTHTHANAKQASVE